jgi:uncharacterized protein YbaR (Trm112 family)
VISLDLGCGQAKQPDTIGVDMVTLSPVDIAANLWKYPLPFSDDSVDNIYLNDVIEHIPNTIPFMEELHRICRNGARVHIRVVYWNTIYMPMDPTHVRGFHENTFDFFGGRQGRNYYTHARFEVVKVVKAWDRFWKRVTFGSEKMLSFLARHLNNVLIDLNFELKAQKPAANGTRTFVDKFDILRCPHCVAGEHRAQGADPGRLERRKDHWLICVEPGCGRKYPIYDGLPIMMFGESEKWISTPAADLPVPPPGKVVRAGPEEFPSVLRHDRVLSDGRF